MAIEALKVINRLLAVGWKDFESEEERAEFLRGMKLAEEFQANPGKMTTKDLDAIQKAADLATEETV